MVLSANTRKRTFDDKKTGESLVMHLRKQHMNLKTLSYSELTQNGGSPALADVLASPADFADSLDIIIDKSSWDYPIPDNVSDVLPIYGHNSNMTVRWKRNGEVEYVDIHHDGPDWHLVARSEQGLIAHILFAWVEMMMCTEEEYKKYSGMWHSLANKLEFNYVAEFWAWVNCEVEDENWILNIQ